MGEIELIIIRAKVKTNKWCCCCKCRLKLARHRLDSV